MVTVQGNRGLGANADDGTYLLHCQPVATAEVDAAPMLGTVDRVPAREAKMLHAFLMSLLISTCLTEVSMSLGQSAPMTAIAESGMCPRDSTTDVTSFQFLKAGTLSWTVTPRSQIAGHWSCTVSPKRRAKVYATTTNSI